MRPLFLVVILASTAATATAGEAATGVESPGTDQWRLLLGIGPGYEVEESAKGSSGSSSFVWNGEDSQAAQFGVQGMRTYGDVGPYGRLVYGVALTFSQADITPASYSSGSAIYVNAGADSLRYQTMAPSLVVGWRFSEPDTSQIGVVWEVQAHAGPTLLHGKLRAQTASGDGFGYGFDAGVRLLTGLQERGWSAAVAAGVRYGWAEAEFELDTYTSTLTLERSGFEALFILGRTF